MKRYSVTHVFHFAADFLEVILEQMDQFLSLTQQKLRIDKVPGEAFQSIQNPLIEVHKIRVAQNLQIQIRARFGRRTQGPQARGGLDFQSTLADQDMLPVGGVRVDRGEKGNDCRAG